MSENKRFGKLLSIGIGSVAGRKSKTRRAVQEELGEKVGVGADAIQWLAKGNTPADLKRLKIIVRYIVENGFVNYSWANSLLFQAQYPDRVGLLSQLFRSEDGGPILEEGFTPPLPEFNSRALKDLETPGGAVKLRDEFYVERQADIELKREVIKPGTTTIIRAPRQTGKTSLLYRGLHYAHQNGLKTVALDIQSVNSADLASIDRFLRFLAEFIFAELRLDPAQVERVWPRSARSPNQKLTHLLRDDVLPQIKTPLALAIDEADRLLGTGFSKDFFSLMRSWHNMRARDEQWDKLNIILVISTEPFLLISDLSQSPFNVGFGISPEDFTEKQVRDLNRRHSSPLAEFEIAPFMTLFNGHPYLTRMALYTMVTDNLTWPELIDRAIRDDGPFAGHLRHHLRLLHNDDGLKETFKEVIRHQCCAGQQAFNRLMQAGLVKGSSENCTCRCELHKIYFKDKL